VFTDRRFHRSKRNTVVVLKKEEVELVIDLRINFTGISNIIHLAFDRVLCLRM
jgi:hypothetical protein